MGICVGCFYSWPNRSVFFMVMLVCSLFAHSIRQEEVNPAFIHVRHSPREYPGRNLSHLLTGTEGSPGPGKVPSGYLSKDQWKSAEWPFILK